MAICLASFLYGHPSEKITSVYWKKVVIPAEVKGNASVILDFFLPAECSGYQLFNRNGVVIKTCLLQEEGGYVRVFFNINGADELSLALLKEQPGHGGRLSNASGLLHTIRKSKEPLGSVDSMDVFMKLWDDSVFVGALFEERVFCGYNPLGPDKDTLHSYDGYIRIEKAGG